MDKKLTIVAAAAAALVGVGAGAALIGQSNSATPAANTTSAASAGTVDAAFTQPDNYTFHTIDDHADPTFNQLLGINDSGLIAGYFGSGAQGHPNKGYQVRADEKTGFLNENVPHSVQTQVTALNDRGVTVGFSSTMNNANQVNDNAGFVDVHGRFTRVVFPTTSNANPAVDQLLGVNDADIAVGFYTDAAGNNHAYRYDITSRRYRTITVAGATSSTAAAIDNDGDVAGFFTNSAGSTDGFLLRNDGRGTVLAFPGATMTQALGVNDHREVVGVYTVGTGNNAQTHGFTWTAYRGFMTVDDPNGVGATTVNGVNDTGALVGFYTDAAGNTDGMLASPVHPSSMPTTTATTPTPPTNMNPGPTTTPGQSGSSSGRLTLQPMPSGTVSLRRNANDTLTAQVNLTGLTPGSAHEAAIDDTDSPASAVAHVLDFGVITADATGQIHTEVTSQGTVASLPAGSAFTVRLGIYGGDGNRNPVAMEAIARSAPLSADLSGYASYSFHAVSDVPGGGSNGQLAGTVEYTFDAAARTLTLTVNASGLSPGAHAAHIHLGSCAVQGAVQYMIPDLQANAQGDVVDQTRVVTGVSALPASGTWYLNIHQGDMNSILVNGAPALSFRPLPARTSERAVTRRVRPDG